MPDSSAPSPAMVATETKVALHAALKTLRSRLVSLSALIAHADRQMPAYAAVLPLREADEAMATTITPENHYGVSARQRAADAIQAIDYQRGQHPSAALRLPAVLAAGDDTLAAAEAVNAAKQALEQITVGLSETTLKLLRAEQSDFAHLHLLAAYRQIRLLDAQPEAVQLAWSSHATANRCMSVARARKLAQHTRQALSAEQAQRAYEQDSAALDELDDDEPLVRRRPVPPTPMANVRTLGITTALGALPFVLLYRHQPSEPATSIRELPERRAEARRRASRMDQLCEREPLLARLHLYRYREALRPIMALPEARIVSEPDGLNVSACRHIVPVRDTQAFYDAIAHLLLCREGVRELAEGIRLQRWSHGLVLTPAEGPACRLNVNAARRLIADAPRSPAGVSV